MIADRYLQLKSELESGFAGLIQLGKELPNALTLRARRGRLNRRGLLRSVNVLPLRTVADTGPQR